MKKIFTLIAAVAVALSANALDFKVTAADIAEGATLVDNEYVTVTTANNTVTPTVIANEDGTPTPATYAGETFPCYVGVRVTDAPSAANPTGTVHDVNVALVFVAKQNTDVTLYYRIGATKSIDCYDQTTGAAESIVQTATNPGEDYLFCTGVYKFQAGHTYTVYAKGGTVQFHGLTAAEGTYVAPTNHFYANASAAKVEGFSTMTYGDGAKVALTGNAGKSYGGASGITINGKKYTTTKVSNGAQNTFYAPAGKKVYVFTLYSYVNKDAATNRPPYWKEVGGVAYDETSANIMQCYRTDITTPDVNTYVFPEGLSEVTFTNTGEQACFVIEANYDATAVAGVEASVEAAPAKALKAVKGGRIVIIRADAEYSVSGAQLK